MQKLRDRLRILRVVHHGIGEYRRVGRKPGNTVLADEALEAPVLEHAATYVVEPGAFAKLVQLEQGVGQPCVHTDTLCQRVALLAARVSRFRCGYA